MKQTDSQMGASAGNAARKTNLAVRTFSPMNENGCYEFDRVLKSGNLQKRTRKTKVGDACFNPKYVQQEES